MSMYDPDSEQEQDHLARHKATMARVLAKVRPVEPEGDVAVSYRGWEVSYDFSAEYWTGEGWAAYKGGCDLDAPCVTASMFKAVLDAVDDEEDE